MLSENHRVFGENLILSQESFQKQITNILVHGNLLVTWWMPRTFLKTLSLSEQKMSMEISFFHYPCAVNHLRELCCPRGQNKMLWMERFWRETAVLPSVQVNLIRVMFQEHNSFWPSKGDVVFNHRYPIDSNWQLCKHFMVTDRWVAGCYGSGMPLL